MLLDCFPFITFCKKIILSIICDQGCFWSVYVPAWLHGSPAALDFAVTAPQRQDFVELASREALSSAARYSMTKRRHLDTEKLCKDAGVEFLPIVCESSGAWSPEAFYTIAMIAGSAAAATGRDKDETLAEALQVLSVTIRQSQARALLRRLALD